MVQLEKIFFLNITNKEENKKPHGTSLILIKLVSRISFLKMLLRSLDKFAAKLSLIGAWISAALLVYMVLHVLVEIFMRVILDSSTFSLDEFVGYAVASMTFLSLGHAFREKSLIRVNILTNSLSGISRKIIDIICILLTISVILFFARYVWRSLYRNWERGTVSTTLMETPIWIVELVFFVGLIIFVIQMTVNILNIIFNLEKI